MISHVATFLVQSKKIVGALSSYFYRVIFPPFCAYCKIYMDDNTVLCTACAVVVIPIASARISLTKTHVMTVHALSDYKDPLRSLILAKSSGRIAVARQLGILMANKLPLEHMQFDYIVPVPLHWRRYAHRGYNQAHEIAAVIAQHTGKPILDCLTRAKNTPFQSHCQGIARLENVRDVFECKIAHHQKYRGASFLLVDDLMTSGATLHHAGRALLGCKPAQIMAAVVCRVI